MSKAKKVQMGKDKKIRQKQRAEAIKKVSRKLMVGAGPNEGLPKYLKILPHTFS